MPHCNENLESLPLLRDIRLLKILRLLIAQFEMHILNSFLDTLLAADANDGAHTLLDAPRCSYTSHAYIVLLRDFLDTFDDLLVGCKLTLVYKRRDKLVCLSAL